MYTALPTTIFCCTPTIKPLYVGCTINLKIGVARVHTLLQIPLWVIYFLDSGGGTYPELVYPDQITWFNKTASDITHTYGPIPALAFFHIPRFASLILPSLSLQSIPMFLLWLKKGVYIIYLQYRV